MMLKAPTKQRERTRLPLPSSYRTDAPPSTETKYPESDGEPMAETDTHRDLMTDALLHPLKERYRDAPDVYVSGNLFLYYEEGDPNAVVAPDVFVVFGVPDHQRRIYKLWEENHPPDIVFELTSKHTYREDLSDKRLVYEELGVREYFLFDPLKDYLRPPLQGFRLKDSYFVAVMPESWDDGEWQIHSQVLGLTLRSDGSWLRLYDPEQERYLLTRSEETEARRQAEARAEAAEAELARLRALLEQQENQP
jgi:Uma2 family endonuclease